MRRLLFLITLLIYLPAALLFEWLYVRPIVWPYTWFANNPDHLVAHGFSLWARWLVGLVKVVCRIRLKVYGELPAEGSYVIVANHQSLVDIPIQVCVLGGTCRPHYVLKKQLRWGIPVVSPGSRLARMAFVDRGKGADHNRRQIEQLAGRITKNGISIVIYPEGTRTRDGRLRKFKSGGLQIIAQTTDAPILPIAIEGLWRAVTFDTIFSNLPFMTIRMVVGPPIPMQRLRDDFDGTCNELRAWMLDNLAALRAEAGDPTPVGQEDETPRPIELPPARYL